MKRFFAILLAVLTVAAVLPLGIPAGAEEITEAPFYAMCWSGIDREQLPNMAGLPTVRLRVKDGKVALIYDSHVRPAKIAQMIKEKMDALPEGMRYLHIFGPAAALDVGVEDGVFLDAGNDQIKREVDEFLQQYYAQDGKLDGVLLDVEYVNMDTWYLYSNYYYQKDASGNSLGTVNPNIYQDIVDNPKYAAQIRPMLAERGFTFNTADPNAPSYTDTANTGVKSELWGIWPAQYKTGEELKRYADCEKIWDTVMGIRLNQYINESIFEPLMKYYPNAALSDGQSQDSSTWLGNMGGGTGTAGNDVKVGNVSSASACSVRPGADFFEKKNLEACNTAFYDDDPYGMFLYDANRFKNMYASTDTKGISAWITGYAYNAKHVNSCANTPYYSETVLHIGMLDPEPFVASMYRSDFDTQQEYDDSMKVISELLNELTRVAGWSDRKPIYVPSNWNDGFVISGMYAGERNIWRITPDTTDGMTLADFLVKDKAPTFRINGKTIIFPQGRVIADAPISTVGTCGYWVETPADAEPVIVTDADRYAQAPSFGDDFDSYAADVSFTGETVKNGEVWNLTGSNPLYIRDVSGSKALALNGTVAIQVLSAPKNLTSADSYALGQAWEVGVTMTSALDGNEKVTLLMCGEEGGFRIEGDKLCYGSSSGFTQFPNLTLTGNKTYTLKRTLNFAVEGAYTGSYYVYDGSTLLAKAESIPMSRVSVPVTTVAMSCEGLKSEKVFLDGFKLYPHCLTADFSLFDGKTGLVLEATGKTEISSVAYRLSWMNATESAKQVDVIMEYYSGDAMTSRTVLKKVLMAPGCDGVLTGIVDNSDGKQVLLYLSTPTSATVSAVPNYDNGDFEWTAKGSLLLNAEDPTDSTENTVPTEPTEPIADTTPVATAPPAEPSDPTAPVITEIPTGPDGTEGEQTKGLGGGAIALIIVGTVLVLGGGGFGVWFFLKKKAAPASDTDTPDTDTPNE